MIDCMFKKFCELINKDVNNGNEVKMYAVILRQLLLINICFCIINVIHGVAFGYVLYSVINCLGVVCSTWFISATYRNRSDFACYATIIMFCIYMYAHSRMFGLDTGVNQLIYVIIIMIFAIDYINVRALNIACMFAVFVFRMIVYSVCVKLPTYYVVSRYTLDHMGAIHMVAISCMIADIVILSTADFSEMRSKLQRANNDMRDIAGKDPLTGLYNRRKTIEEMEKYIAEYENGDMNAVTVVMTDVDHFKRVNDTYGHDNGDIVLVDLANIFGAFMRGKGLASRWGGEEFVLVFKDCNGDEVYEQLTSLRNEVKNKLQYDINNDKVCITLTYGVAEFGSGQTMDDVIKEADEKLYLGKKQGRDVIIY